MLPLSEGHSWQHEPYAEKVRRFPGRGTAYQLSCTGSPTQGKLAAFAPRPPWRLRFRCLALGPLRLLGFLGLDFAPMCAPGEHLTVITVSFELRVLPPQHVNDTNRFPYPGFSVV